MIPSICIQQCVIVVIDMIIFYIVVTIVADAQACSVGI